MTSPLADPARRLLTVLIALAAIVPAAARAADKPKPGGPKVGLRVKYLPGKYLMTMTQDMKQNITAGGQEQQQTIVARMEMMMEVSKPGADGAREAKIIYKRIKQSVKMGAMSQEFDSNDPAKSDGPLAAALKPLIGAELTLTIAADGKATKVAGLDEIIDKQAKANPAAAQRLRQTKASMSKSLKDMVSASARTLPSKPVAPGEKWDAESPVNVPFIGQVNVKQACTLEKVEKTAAGQIAHLSVKGTMKSDKATTTAMGPATLTVKKLEMNYDAKTRFDVKLGMAVSATTRLKGMFDMSIVSPNGAAQDMAIQMDGTVTVTQKKLAGP